MRGAEAVVVGGGPSGMIAAEHLASAGIQVTVIEHMATAGRKLLIAGRGGLNLTHSEPLDELLGRYRNAPAQLLEAIRSFTPADLAAWCESLGQPTFVGTSGRIFPTALRATPLLRAWLDRLHRLGVQFRLGHRYVGVNGAGGVLVHTADGLIAIEAGVTVLALGGATWPRTGSDGGWVESLERVGVLVNDLRAANSGFGVPWSEHFRQRFAWQPLKNVRLTFGSRSVRGEAMITDAGIEGGVVYALSAELREAIERDGVAELVIDLHPDISDAQLQTRLQSARRDDSSATRLRRAGLSAVAIGLLRETATGDGGAKSLRLRLTFVAPMARAISTAGGIAWSEVDDSFMLRRLPGVFVAGEMLDWEAPTGGYLLQGCFSTGVAAAAGARRWLRDHRLEPVTDQPVTDQPGS